MVKEWVCVCMQRLTPEDFVWGKAPPPCKVVIEASRVDSASEYDSDYEERRCRKRKSTVLTLTNKKKRTTEESVAEEVPERPSLPPSPMPSTQFSMMPFDTNVYIALLTDTIASQHATINAMVIEQRLEAKYRAELNSQKELLASAKARELELERRIESLSAAAETERPLTKREADAVPPEDLTLYAWTVLVTHPERCLDLYGFTAPQLMKIRNYIGVTPIRRKKNAVSMSNNISTETRLLFILYFATKYATFNRLQTLFRVSGGRLSDLIVVGVETIAPILFAQSISQQRDQPITFALVYHTHFMPIVAPQDHSLANRYYNDERNGYGVLMHYIVDPASHKVLIFTTGSLNAWPMATGCGATRATEEDHDYGFRRRMTAKFAVVGEKYRGSLTDHPLVVQLVVALTNLDIEFDNPLVETDDSEDSSS